MDKHKASKLKRQKARPIRLTERDREILLALHRYRFLTTDHLMTLTGTISRWGMNARLRLLYDHKYVDRPKAQYAIFAYADKRPIVYALGNQGASLLSTRYGLKMPAKVYWTEKNRRVRERHIEHTLGISDFMIGVEMMCRERDHLEFIDPQTIINNSPAQTQRTKYPFRWKTTIEHNGERQKISLVPDYVFGLRELSSGQEKYYFVEIDNGTMPVKRRDNRQTSYLRKVLSYADTFENKIAQNRFEISGFQVLTVTTSSKRIESIQAAIDGLTKKTFLPNTFLFKTKTGKQAKLPLCDDWRNWKETYVKRDLDHV